MPSQPPCPTHPPQELVQKHGAKLGLHENVLEDGFRQNAAQKVEVKQGVLHNQLRRRVREQVLHGTPRHRAESAKPRGCGRGEGGVLDYNQPTKQPTSQSLSRSINQATNQWRPSINQSTTSQPVSQSFTKHINHSPKQPVNQATTSQPISHPLSEPTSLFTKQARNQPTDHSINRQSINQSINHGCCKLPFCVPPANHTSIALAHKRDTSHRHVHKINKKHRGVHEVHNEYRLRDTQGV